MPRSVKIAPGIDAKLYEELVFVAQENEQSQRFVLERALEHSVHNVVPSQRLVRPGCLSSLQPKVSGVVQAAGQVTGERMHLTVTEVMVIHHHQMEEYGRAHGLRDQGALEAAVFRPQTATTTTRAKRRPHGWSRWSIITRLWTATNGWDLPLLTRSCWGTDLIGMFPARLASSSL